VQYANKVYVKLHRELYPKEVLAQARANEPESVISVKTERDYYLVELDVRAPSEYFDFLNYLICLKRNG
jgi:hypothetical protein